MELKLRLETPNDYHAVEVLTREAFWGFTHPTCDEHYLVHLLRGVPAFVPELDFVAEYGDKLVGNVIYSKAKVVDKNGVEHEVLTFGPLSVLPEFWHKGVGSALMQRSIPEAKQLGYRGIVFYGHPDYYPRFGFQNAEVFGITDPKGQNFDALMAMELWDGALNGISGAFHEDSAFNMDEKAVDAYNRKFTHKEPTELISIEVLLSKLEPSAQKAFQERKIETLPWLNRFSGREMLKWEGINEQVIAVVNETLKAHGYAQKLLPNSEVLERAKSGVKVLLN